MADSNTARQTIDEEFIEEQYGQTGISNVRVHRVANDNTREAANDNRGIQNVVVEQKEQSRSYTVPTPVKAQQQTRSVAGMGLGAIKKVKAWGITIGFIWPFCGWLYIAQVVFWIIGMIGYAVEDFWVTGWLLPGAGVFAIANMIIMFLGWTSLFIGFITYLFWFVKPLKGTALLLFGIAIAGYAVPFINILPWFVFWTLAVLWNAGRKHA